MNNQAETPQEIVEQIIAELENCPEDMDSATHFQLVTESFVNKQLTETLCCSDTYDTILTIDGEHWLLIDEGKGYSSRYLGTGELLYGWTEEMLGETLSAEQKSVFSSALAHELGGITVVDRELTAAETAWQEYFVDKLEDLFKKAVDCTH